MTGGPRVCAEKSSHDGQQSQGEDLLPEAEVTGHDHLGGEEREAYKVLTGRETVTYETWFEMNTKE